MVIPHRKHTAFEWIGIESMNEPQQTTHNHTQCQWWLTKTQNGCGGKKGAHSSINTNTTMSCVCEHHLVSWCSHKGDMVTTWQTHHMEGKGDCTNQSTLCGIQQWHTPHHNHPQTNGLPQHMGTTNNTILTKPSVSTTTPFSITCVFAPLFGVVVSQHIKTIHRLSSNHFGVSDGEELCSDLG